MEHAEVLHVDGCYTVLQSFDQIEIKDVSEELPGLKKYIGQRMSYDQKARVVIEQAAYYWLRKGQNYIENIAQPLTHYPELSVPCEVLKFDKDSKEVEVEITCYYIAQPGREPVKVKSQRAWALCRGEKFTRQETIKVTVEDESYV